MSVCQSVSRAFCLKNRIEKNIALICTTKFFLSIKKRIRKEGLTTDSNDKRKQKRNTKL